MIGQCAVSTETVIGHNLSYITQTDCNDYQAEENIALLIKSCPEKFLLSNSGVPRCRISNTPCRSGEKLRSWVRYLVVWDPRIGAVGIIIGIMITFLYHISVSVWKEDTWMICDHLLRKFKTEIFVCKQNVSFP